MKPERGTMKKTASVILAALLLSGVLALHTEPATASLTASISTDGSSDPLAGLMSSSGHHSSSGVHWRENAGTDEEGDPAQDPAEGDNTGGDLHALDKHDTDGHQLWDGTPGTLALEYGVYRTLPLNIVFVGFEEEVVDTGIIDANVVKDYQRTYGGYDIGYGFDVSYHLADPSYFDALRTFVLTASGNETATTSALNTTALEIQKATGTPMSIFMPQSGRAVDAISVEEWFVTNPFSADLEPAYWFYVINFTELDPVDPDSKHWYTVTELDYEANRLRDFWRLEWDNELNPDVGFPYACFTSQSRVFFIDPSAHQWYLQWAKIWWQPPVTGPKYEYYETDLGEFLVAHDVSSSEGRTALAYYLAGWIEDGLMNLLAPSLYTGVDVFHADSLSVQVLLLNNASDPAYDNEAMSWILDSQLCTEAIEDLAPWIDVEVVPRFEYLEDLPELEAIFEGAVIENDGGWTYYDGMQVWNGLFEARESYFDFTTADVVINSYIYIEENMSMWVYAGEYTGLGGGRQVLVMKELGRYFEDDGLTPKSGLGLILVHEVGHNLGFPHTFAPTAHAGDFAFDVMGYYPYSLSFTRYRKDSFRRLVVDFRLLSLQERLDRVSESYALRTPHSTIDAQFSQVYSEIDDADRLYEQLEFVEAYEKCVDAGESLGYLEYLVSEYFPEEEPAPGCFIATAAYGTPMAGEIQILREFRDRYLLTNRPGQAFVDFYYRTSPPLAAFITDHPGLQPAVRVALVPAIAVSTLAIDTTLADRMAILGLLTLASAALIVWTSRRRAKDPPPIPHPDNEYD
jgi:hypothetical protein